MSTEAISLLVAVVGVAGTLLAPITTARVGARARLLEFEIQQRADGVSRRIDEAQRSLERRRETYVALNSSARRYRILLMDDLHNLRRGSPLDPEGDTDAARIEFQHIYGQAQMLVPDSVLEACHAVRVALADARKQINNLHTDDAQLDLARWQEVHAFLLQVWDVIGLMQNAMRQDLGITTSPQP